MAWYRDLFLVGGILGSICFIVPLWGPTLIFGRPPTVDVQTFGRSFGIGTFSTDDIIILIGYCAVANLPTTVVATQSQTGGAIFVALFVSIWATAIWGKCQQFMNERNILSRKSRALVQIVIYPLSVLVVTECVWTLCLLIATITALLIAMFGRMPDEYSPLELLLFALTCCIGFAFCTFVLWALRKTFSRLVLD